MRAIGFLLISALGQGATVTVCTSGCTTASLQTALNTTANCGDTIQIRSTDVQSGNFTIQARGCTAANPITVTSDRANWLPPAGGRITPSHLGNMAVISTPNSNPALRDVLNAGVPAGGWVFRGLAFRSTCNCGTYFLVYFNSYEATNQTQLAHDIVFDQTYFYRPLPNTGARSVQDMLRADAVRVDVKNSFFGDGFWNGFVESHAVRMLTTPGPVTVTNTFITTSGIPIFSGGNPPSYPTYVEDGLTARYNYSWRPWKWNLDPAQPYAADYTANVAGTQRSGPYSITNVSNSGIVTTASSTVLLGNPSGSVMTIAGVGGCTAANRSGWRINNLSGTTFQLIGFPGCNSAYTSGGTATEYALTVCSKNHGELKWASNVVWQYNVAENSWHDSSCQSQWTGFTGTLRTNWDWNVTTPSIGVFQFTDATHLTWTGSYRLGNQSTGACCNVVGDMAVCISMPTTGTECHPIASFSEASLVAGTPFSAAPVGNLNGWFSYTASAKLTDLLVTDNVFRDTDAGMTSLGLSYANLGIGEAGKGARQRFENNLWVIRTPYISGYTGIGMGAGEADYNTNPTQFDLVHNTLFTPYGLAHGAFVYLAATNCQSPSQCATSKQPKYEDSKIDSNLFGKSASGGNGPFSGDAVNGIRDVANFYFLNSSLQNNGIPGGVDGGSACGTGNTCLGNLYNSWSDPFGGLEQHEIYKLKPQGTYSQAAKDGDDIGVNFDRLPLVTGLKVTAGVQTAVLEFDVAGPIQHVRSTQPCALEVSSSRNLHSDLDVYTVIPDLDPVFFLQGDSSARTNSLLPAVVMENRHVIWPLGRSASVVGNDGVSHNLALSPGTVYYGRLMCYGDTRWFQFQTGSTGTSIQYPLSAVLRTQPTAGTTAVRLRYGATTALGSQQDFTVEMDGSVRVNIPLSNPNPVYYQLEYLNGTTVTYTSPMGVTIGGV